MGCWIKDKSGDETGNAVPLQNRRNGTSLTPRNGFAGYGDRIAYRYGTVQGQNEVPCPLDGIRALASLVGGIAGDGDSPAKANSFEVGQLKGRDEGRSLGEVNQGGDRNWGRVDHVAHRARNGNRCHGIGRRDRGGRRWRGLLRTAAESEDNHEPNGRADGHPEKDASGVSVGGIFQHGSLRFLLGGVGLDRIHGVVKNIDPGNNCILLVC